MNKEVPPAAASAELPGAAGALSRLSVPHAGCRRDLACILLLLALNTRCGPRALTARSNCAGTPVSITSWERPLPRARDIAC